MVITPPSDKPDLEIDSPSVSDDAPDAGASFTLRATVRNGGDGRSAATTLRYYQSSDSTISTSDTAVGTDAVGALAASGTSAESISLTAPSSAGTYYYGACVDMVTGESDTANNCSSAVRVSVAAPTVPDLLVGSASVSDSSPDAGASFTLSATVRNGGDGQSAATTLRYYRSSNATISTSDTAVGTDTVSALAASGTSAESISLTAPSSAGTYYYGACVDTVSGESNTANNCSSGVRVTVADDHSDTRSGATSLSLGSSRSGRIETGSDVDYFRVRVSGSGTLTVHTTGNLDTVGELQSSSGSTLTDDDDDGSGRNFRIRRSVSAGTYYIRVESHGSGTGSYTVHASLDSGRYGAIAHDLNRGCSSSGGIALDHSTSQDALNAAIRACQNDGGDASDCRIKPLSFRSCGALHYCAERTGSLIRCTTIARAGPTLRSVESRPLDSRCLFTHRLLVSGCNSN